MSVTAGQAFRTVTFGDLDAAVWGVCWGAAEPMLAVGFMPTGTVRAGIPVTVEGSAIDEEWRVAGDGVELTFSVAAEALTSGSTTGLCRVHGPVELSGMEHQFDCLGARHIQDLDLGRYRSVRELSAWFAADQGLTVSALRPREVAGHDLDVLTATVFEPTGALAVAEPRLSTSYAADGSPTRVGLELWIEEGEDGQQYPRRAAAESVGVPARWSQERCDVEAQAMRWHSRGLDGTGVHVVVRSR